MMNRPNALCRCKSCLEKQRLSKLHFTPKFQKDVKELFEGFDIDVMTESLKLVFNLALYHTDVVLDQRHQEAFYQVNLLGEGMEALGK